MPGFGEADHDTGLAQAAFSLSSMAICAEA